MRQRHSGAHCLIEHKHAVVLSKCGDKTAHHLDGGNRVGLCHLQCLKAPRQRRILLDVALVLTPGGSADRAQGSSRERRLEQVGRIASSRLPTRTDQGVHLVDEEDDGLYRLSRLFQQGLEARLELPSHARTGQQRANIETPESAVFQVGRNFALGDGQCQPFDHRRLADTRIAREQGVVLATAKQNVDHRADLVPTANDGVDLPLRSALGEIRAVATQCRLAIRRRIRERGAGLARQRRRQTGAIMRSLLPFGRACHDRADGLCQLICRDSLEFRRDAKKHTPQFRRLKQRGKQPGTTHAMRTELEAGQHPCALDGRFDVAGKIGQ